MGLVSSVSGGGVARFRRSSSASTEALCSPLSAIDAQDRAASFCSRAAVGVGLVVENGGGSVVIFEPQILPEVPGTRYQVDFKKYFLGEDHCAYAGPLAHRREEPPKKGFKNQPGTWYLVPPHRRLSVLVDYSHKFAGLLFGVL